MLSSGTDCPLPQPPLHHAGDQEEPDQGGQGEDEQAEQPFAPGGWARRRLVASDGAVFVAAGHLWLSSHHHSSPAASTINPQAMRMSFS